MLKKPKPSEYLRRHLGGDGYALDDLVHRYDRDPEYEDVLGEVLAISQQFRSSEYPIGIGNPESSPALKALAEKLEAESR